MKRSERRLLWQSRIQALQTSGESNVATGRPKFLTPEQEQQVYQTVVELKPVDVGFPTEMNWTAPLVCKWIQQTFQVKYSDRGTRDLLYRLISYTRPTYTLEKTDVAKQEAFKEAFETVKKAP
ncbi:winged helix-turn-helix domain-containing protein [Solibacillus sp. FSL H8-0538]|uniref:winged helix-turn-helix domain-containing protein n=1 Tax=Solibacillus sp. FSL H8-0538 TaxID=2921400 RepID=UPI0030F52531